MRTIILIAAGLALLASAPAFASMNSDIFYNKALALKKKGAGALFSSDLKLLKKEGEASHKALKAENEVAKKKGKPLFCPPKGTKYSSDELLSDLRALGAPVRKSMTLTQAMRKSFSKRYPCS